MTAEWTKQQKRNSMCASKGSVHMKDRNQLNKSAGNKIWNKENMFLYNSITFITLMLSMFILCLTVSSDQISYFCNTIFKICVHLSKVIEESQKPSLLFGFFHGPLCILSCVPDVVMMIVCFCAWFLGAYKRLTTVLSFFGSLQFLSLIAGNSAWVWNGVLITWGLVAFKDRSGLFPSSFLSCIFVLFSCPVCDLALWLLLTVLYGAKF